MSEVKRIDAFLAQLDAWEELVQRASTPPWMADTVDNIGANWLIASLGNSQLDGLDHIVTTGHVHTSEFDGDPKHDSDFIVMARTALPILIRGYRKQLKRRREELADG